MMKIKPVFIFVLLISTLLAACGAPSAPAQVPPTAAIEPTATLYVSPDPTWDRIQSSGRIVFGTSADYAPFEYYDENYQIVGFDAALAREVGARLGLQVEIKDIAFESLLYDVQLGQLDAAIAAISITPSRQSVVDFSNVYYSGQDMAIARQGSGIGQLVAATQLGQYRVGVERGSVYQTWLQTSLVDAGLMPPVNLFAYEKPEHAVRDLRESRIDIVVMGSLPAKTYIAQGGLETVGQGFNNQLFAIAIPKGASITQMRINEVLTQLQNDGTIARLNSQYLNIDISQVLPVVQPTAIPTSAPAAPAPTAVPAACYDGMDFVADLSIPDNTVLNPRQDFNKVWRIKNTGTCTWDNSYSFVFVQGDVMGGNSQSIRGSVKPGESYDMSVALRSPSTSGKYGGVWQMLNGMRVPFGARVWVKIRVPGEQPAPTTAPKPTAVPTKVPPVPVQPTLEPPTVVINNLSASATSVTVGDTVSINWSYSGQDLVAARLTRTNPDGTQTPLYGGADVDYQGQYDDRLMEAGTYTYSLSVSSEYAGTVVKTVTITSNP